MTLRDWLQSRYTIWSWDVGLGAVTALVVAIVSAVDEPIRRASHDLLLAEAALGVALLAVSLTALAILVAFLNEEYVTLLRASIGIPQAFQPYKTIARVAGSMTLVSGTGAFAWPHVVWPVRVALLAISCGLAVWSLIGTIQLVSITAHHGELRSRMPEIAEAARDAIRQRRSNTSN